MDFSDRISGKRKSYRASSRRRRRRAGEVYGEELEDEDYDSEELYGEETLERRLARLRREVEELKNEVAAREEEAKGGDGSGGEGVEEDEELEDEVDENRFLRLGIDDLSDALEGLQTVSAEERGAQAKLAKKLATSLSVAPTTAPDQAATTTETLDIEVSPLLTLLQALLTPQPPTFTPGTTASYTVTYSPAFKKSHALAKAADFDNRLTVLEKVLGMSASALSNLDRALPSSAMIPTLEELSRQMSVLTNSSTSSLDAASRRVKQLTSEAEKLAEARKAAKAAADARRDAAGESDMSPGVPSEGNSERDAKINALYGSLPTIENLGPLLPAVLDRLRSLRTIHADAGRAVESLSKVERRQEEMSGEIARWREALEKVEGVVKESEGTVKANMAQVEGWIKELEAKCKMVEEMEAA